MIKINGLKKEYSRDFVLQTDSLIIEDAQRVALIGSNGSGKTTLLRLLAGYMQPDCGTIQGIPQDAVYSPQEPYVFNTSVLDNVTVGLDGSRERRREDALAALKRVELEGFAHKRARRLSGGETQRMVFARLIACKRSLMLLDEPFSAADIESARLLRRVLIQYCKENGTTLVIATHTPPDAVEVCERIIIMNNGKIAEDGTACELLREPQTPFGKAFLSGWRL